MNKPERPQAPLAPSDYSDIEVGDLDNPEWTEDDFARARPIRDVLPELHEALKNGVALIAPAAARKAS